MELDWWTLALQAINALVLIWLLHRFLFRPVAEIIATRREAAERLLDEAEAAREGARAERARTREEAEAQAARRAEAIRAAETEAADRAARLAVDIAARLFGRLPPEAQVSGFIPGLAKALAALPEDARDRLAPQDRPLRLRAPRALEPEEAAACRAALAGALGRPVEIEVEVDRAVIAGLEAEGPLGSARNSFRADLEKITEALTRHDAASA
jgi:F-type H+-transporting ATPase subunit b